MSTLLAIIVANTPLNKIYQYIFSGVNLIGEFNLHMIINDFLMAIFFLLAGCEIKHEVLHGHLSTVKKATFPVMSACGGVIIPACIYFLFNHNTKFVGGIGIPISTDIAFAVGIFMLLKNKLEPSLKIFLLSLAVVDDLISILVIGTFYSSNLSVKWIIGSLIIVCILAYMNKKLKISDSYPYLLLGLVLWYFVYRSGIHSTISGVLLAIVIPAKSYGGRKPLLERLQEKIAPICNFFILPLFAFSNTAIKLGVKINYAELGTMVHGIIVGLVVGKPLGIMSFSYIGTKLHIIEKPENCSWISLLQVAMLAGIGFTMSIFVAEIAFVSNAQLIDTAKISILLAAVLSASLTYITTLVKPLFHKKPQFKHAHALIGKLR
ncbi:Na+/H+ antiporter NhaA [Romboutsia maritimum]|uniref:Na(+)/H(+) antiporter NhaA n=1 Tax=Romboutsia maritimum TaxID=2020948 RepID=A0A371ISQ9_9FIRM|nr:Na+/H+ antiporter NhaA [Romboutsia maritimum]